MKDSSRPRLRDIAKSAGVSISTVSLVINDKPGVSDDTRREVRALLAEHGYKSTRARKDDRSRTILFAVYDRSDIRASHNPFFNEVLRGVEREARRDGFGLTVAYISDENHLDEFVTSIVESPPGGLLIDASVMDDAAMRRVRAYTDAPVVVLDNYFPDISVDTVAIDNHGGTVLAVEHLIAMGHTRIGTIGSSVRTRNFDERQAAFSETLRHAGLAPNADWVFDVTPTQDGSLRDMTRIFENTSDLPDAVFAQNDIIAFGTIGAAKVRGMKLPDGLSVVAFDNLPFSDILEPRLSTVHVNTERLTAIAVKRLIERIADKDVIEFTKTRVGTDLVIRDSVSDIRN